MTGSRRPRMIVAPESDFEAIYGPSRGDASNSGDHEYVSIVSEAEAVQGERDVDEDQTGVWADLKEFEVGGHEIQSLAQSEGMKATSNDSDTIATHTRFCQNPPPQPATRFLRTHHLIHFELPHALHGCAPLNHKGNLSPPSDTRPHRCPHKTTEIMQYRRRP